MRNDRITVLLLAESETDALSLARFIEQHGCVCSFATQETAGDCLKSHAFDLVLSSTPLKQADALIRTLEGGKCRVFYRLPVEDGCWWVPLDGRSAKCVGRAALRSSEFSAALVRVINELRDRDISVPKESHGATHTMMRERLKSILDREHVAYSTILHAPAYGAQYAAAVMHIHGKDVAKTVVFRGGKDISIAVLPASYRINLKKLETLVHSPVELVEEEECKRLFPDCEAGVFPAFGELYGLPVYMDEALAEEPDVVFGAGSRSEGVQLANADFVRLVKPRVCSFAEPSRRHSCGIEPEEEEQETIPSQ